MMHCMEEPFIRIKEGEFVRQLQSKAITKVLAQESTEKPLRFVVVAINQRERIAYAMRHGRNSALRTWRLDNLAKFLKANDVTSFDVKYQQ